MLRGRIRNIQPPLVVLLDVLFIFLFVSVLEKPPAITFKLPPKKLFNGGYIASVDGQSKRIFDFENGRFLDSFKFSDESHAYYFSQPCGQQEECIQVRKLTKGELIIVITDKTYDEIARLTFIGASIDPSNASNIHFTIKEDGSIDINELVKDNPIFKKFEGFNKYTDS